MNSEKSPYGSRLQRLLFFILGSVFVALATAGACYYRFCQRRRFCYYSGLLRALFESFSQLAATNRIFGPTIRQWQESRSIALRTKVIAIGMLVVTLGSSVVFFVPLWPIKLLLVAVGVWVIRFLLRLPITPPSDGGDRVHKPS